MSPLLLRDLAVTLGVAAGTAALLARVGVPSIVGFLLAGALVGPSGLALVADPGHVRAFAEPGVALLLLTVGMEFSIGRLAETWRTVVLGGGLQVGLTLLAALGIAGVAGADPREGLFWGYLAASSSTALVMRLLRDRGEIDAPHAKIVVGVLLFQDLCVVPMMMTLPLLAAGSGGGGGDVIAALARSCAVVAGVLILARVAVPMLLDRVVRLRQRETFLLALLGIATTIALATASMGLSLALGGFLAGVVLADSEYVWQARSEVAPLRDALASLFFVSVGMMLDPEAILRDPVWVLGLAALLFVGKAVTAGLAALLMRFPLRVAVPTGLGLAQVGEFSFALLAAGQVLGLVPAEEGRQFLAAAVLTMFATPLAVGLSPRLAAGARLLRPLEWAFAVRTPLAEERRDALTLRDHVVVAGMGLAGQMLVRAMEAARAPYLALDVDPDVVRAARRKGWHVRFGDASSPEVLEEAALAPHARLLVVLVTEVEATLRVAAIARARWPHVRVVARVRRAGADAARLRAAGCEVVVEENEAALEVVERVLRRRTDRLLGDTARTFLGPEAPVEDVRGALRLDGVALCPGDRLVGASLGDSRIRSRTHATIVAVSRHGVVSTRPSPSLVLEPGDVIVLFGTPAEVEHARAWIRRASVPAPA